MDVVPLAEAMLAYKISKLLGILAIQSVWDKCPCPIAAACGHAA